MKSNEKKNMDFLMMKSISDSMGNEDRKLSNEELINRVKLNIRLFKENMNPEKMKMHPKNMPIPLRISSAMQIASSQISMTKTKKRSFEDDLCENANARRSFLCGNRKSS